MRTAAEVRRHLGKFVKTELFRGEESPPETSRRYYPTDGDIRNILQACHIGDRKAPDDQSNLEIKCREWKESNPDDFIYYRVCTVPVYTCTEHVHVLSKKMSCIRYTIYNILNCKCIVIQ